MPKAVNTVTISSGSFFADEMNHEKYPVFKSDGQQIENELEWHLHETIRVSLPIAHEMIEKEIMKKRSLGAVGGCDVCIKFNLSVVRDGQGFSDKHQGYQIQVFCTTGIIE